MSKVVGLLRDAASELEEEGCENVLFPGWDFQPPISNTSFQDNLLAVHSIRDVAWAILNNTEPDNGIIVPKYKIAIFLQYLADMME